MCLHNFFVLKMCFLVKKEVRLGKKEGQRILFLQDQEQFFDELLVR